MIRVYFNLHKRLFSVQEKTEKGWRVVRHTDELLLKNVEFKVYEAGRQRVLKEKRKNVHAYVIGEETDYRPVEGIWHDVFPVFYDPYRHSTFIDGIKKPIYSADYISLKVFDKTPLLMAYLENPRPTMCRIPTTRRASKADQEL